MTTVFLATVTLAGLGLCFGTGLGIAAKKFGVTGNVLEEKIMGILPGANCSACGFPGCQAFASALASGKASANSCVAEGGKLSSRIADVMGVKVERPVSTVAVVRCRGGKSKLENQFTYRGIENCLAASLIQGGGKVCSYGCLGFGSCVEACPFDALKMSEDGLPVVDEGKCTGCGICVKACPKNIIQLIPTEQKVYVACSSQDSGKRVRKICSVGCFGCGVCARVSPETIIMEGNLPRIQPDNSEKTATAAGQCPVEALIVRENVSDIF